MRRRRFLACLAGGAALAAARVEAADMSRVGLLWVGADHPGSYDRNLRAGLRAQGFEEGRNVLLQPVRGVERYEDLDAAAALLLRTPVDVLVTFGATATSAAQKASRTIPVVFVVGADPVKMGYGASLAHPGGNLTGIGLVAPELHDKRLELLKQLAPRARRVGMLFNASSPTEAASVERVREVGRALGLDVEPVGLRFAPEIGPTIAAAARSGLDAFDVTGSTMLIANMVAVISAIARTRRPAVYASANFVEAGGLVSHGPDQGQAFRSAGESVARILRGSKPGEMPIELSSRYELVVNARVAKEQGIALPPMLLTLADRVIDS